LIAAESIGHIQAVKVLLAKVADVNAKGNKGRAALMRASREGHDDLVKVLVAKDAEVNAEGNKIRTASAYASPSSTGSSGTHSDSAGSGDRITDTILSYAYALEASNKPHCGMLAGHLQDIAYNGLPDNIRIAQANKILSGRAASRCP